MKCGLENNITYTTLKGWDVSKTTEKIDREKTQGIDPLHWLYLYLINSMPNHSHWLVISSFAVLFMGKRIPYALREHFARSSEKRRNITCKLAVELGLVLPFAILKTFLSELYISLKILNVDGTREAGKVQDL